MQNKTEPIFENPLRSPGIDSQPGGPVRRPYLSYWPASLHRLAESISGLLTFTNTGSLLQILQNLVTSFVLFLGVGWGGRGLKGVGEVTAEVAPGKNKQT